MVGIDRLLTQAVLLAAPQEEGQQQEAGQKRLICVHDFDVSWRQMLQNG